MRDRRAEDLVLRAEDLSCARGTCLSRGGPAEEEDGGFVMSAICWMVIIGWLCNGGCFDE